LANFLVDDTALFFVFSSGCFVARLAFGAGFLVAGSFAATDFFVTGVFLGTGFFGDRLVLHDRLVLGGRLQFGQGIICGFTLLSCNNLLGGHLTRVRGIHQAHPGLEVMLL
jgi:hypothetical protein